MIDIPMYDVIKPSSIGNKNKFTSIYDKFWVPSKIPKYLAVLNGQDRLVNITQKGYCYFFLSISLEIA